MNRPSPHTLIVLAVLAIALALPGLWLDARMFFASWLAAWWCCLGLILGAVVNGWMHAMTGGNWGHPLQAVTLAMARRMPWLLLLFVPMAAGLKQLYPWAADSSGAWAADFARPAFVIAWLQPGFFWLRMLAYAALWWLLSRPAMLTAGRPRAVIALLLHTLAGTLAAVDLLMSLVPGWFSTAFGLVVLSEQALGGTALAVLMLAAFGRHAVPAQSHGKPPLWRDWANLLLMWLMTWAYLAFMQFLVIWAENLPREISWYLPRLQTGWWWFAVALVLLQFALPMLALLFRDLKDHPRRLAWIAGLLLVSHVMSAAWLVLPSVDAHSLLGWWLVPMLTIGFGLLLFGHLPRQIASAEAVPFEAEAVHARP
jgi:hypothetical protein